MYNMNSIINDHIKQKSKYKMNYANQTAIDLMGKREYEMLQGIIIVPTTT